VKPIWPPLKIISLAVIEGWAPAPTNAYQRAVWDEVKSEKERGPSNALKIVPGK